MKKTIKTKILLNCLLLSTIAIAQTTVFEDNFNRTTVSPGPEGVIYTTSALKNDRTPQTSLPALSRTTITMPASTVATAVTLNNEALNLLQGGAGTNDSGAVFVSAPISAYGAPFNSTLSSNTGLITWTINLRTNRGSDTGNGLSGFAIDGGGTNYGMAVVLASNNANLMLGTGYVLTFNQYNSSSSNTVALRKMNDGVVSGSTPVMAMTSFIQNNSTTPSLLLANRYNFASVKVTYNPFTNVWALFLRDDGITTWTDPSSGTYTQIASSVVDNTYTSTPMTHFGYFYHHGQSNVNQNQAFFDNFKVTHDPTMSSDNFASKINLSVYPNPADNFLKLSFNEDSEISGYEISNAIGQVVKKSSNIVRNDTTIDISDLQNSMYFVKLHLNNNEFAMYRFLKK